MPMDEAVTGPEQLHIGYSNALHHLANGMIRPGFDGDPPSDFYNATDFALRDTAVGPAGVRLIPANQLGATTGTPTNEYVLRGDRVWAMTPPDYLNFQVPGALAAVPDPVFEWTPETVGVLWKGRARCKTAPTGADVVFDVIRNGGSMLSSSKLHVAAGSNRGSLTVSSGLFQVFVAGDHLTFTIAQVGSSSTGADAALQWAFIPIADALP